MMSALLFNEWCSFRRSLRTVLLVCLVAIVLLAGGVMASDDNTSGMQLAGSIATVASLFSALPLFAAIRSFSLSEQSHWDEAVLALPVTRTAAVRSRYLFCLALLAAGAIVSSLLCAALAAAMGIPPASALASGEASSALVVLAAEIGLFLALLSIMMPLCYAFGAQKGTMSILLVPAFAMFAPLGRSFFGDAFALLAETPPVALAAGLIGAGLALYALSCLISSAILKRRSF